MRTEKAVTVSQETWRDATAGMSDWIKGTVTALVSHLGQNGVKMVDNGLQAMLQVLVNTTLNEKLNSIKFGDRLLRNIEEATLIGRQVQNMTEAMLHNQDFIAPVANILSNETKKAGNV